jgi:hypothetical protein
MTKVAKMDDEGMLRRRVLPFHLICSTVRDGVFLLLSFGKFKDFGLAFPCLGHLGSMVDVTSFHLIPRHFSWWTWDGVDHKSPQNVPRADCVVVARKQSSSLFNID